MRFSDQIDMTTRTMHTEVDVPNPKFELVPGMYASVKIPLHAAAKVLTVPIQAVQATGEGKGAVLVVGPGQQDRAARRDSWACSPQPTSKSLPGCKKTTPSFSAASGQYQDRGKSSRRSSSCPRAIGPWNWPAWNRRLDAFICSPTSVSDHRCFAFSFACSGLTSLARMPVDMFPPINIPVVLVATFYSGMPPQQIEADITDTFERFFTLASGVDHMESRSLTGVSLIKIYFPTRHGRRTPTSRHISNLAMADLRRLPQGTLPPVVMKVDASSLPVCLLTVSGEGLNETQLHDYLQYQIRNQIAGVPGCNRSAALRRQVPADHGLRGPAQACRRTS